MSDPASTRTGRFLRSRRRSSVTVTCWSHGARAVPARVCALPGGVVEAGEMLHEALVREVMEETGIAIEPVGLAGYREHVEHDDDGRVRRHFVILPFACRWISGEGVPHLEELSELRWLRPSGLSELTTTPGLAGYRGGSVRADGSGIRL